MTSTTTGLDEQHVWQAGDLEVDVRLQRVLQAGRPVELPKLSFELLLTLLQTAPRFVSNEELMQRVWRGLVVSPETVTQRVKLLRDALGDDPRQPRYIEGLRSRGYRVLPEVARREIPAAPARTAAARPIRIRAWPTYVAVAASLLLVGTVIWRGWPVTKTTADPVVTEADRTVAVLPFLTRDASAADGDLALGLADSVQAALSGVRGLTVISRNSSSQVNIAALGLTEAGNRLGARYLVDASLQREQATLRVVAKLIDSRSGAQLWTRQYDRAAGDFFGMQDAVAGDVARALEARIAGVDPTIPVGPRSGNVQAQLAFLRGRALLGRTTIVGSEAAAREFEQALMLDPDFAPALIGLFDARMQAASLRRTDPVGTYSANTGLLKRAEVLQPGSGAAHLARAMWSDAPREQRLADFEAGLQRDPANARAMTAYSELLDQADRREQAALWLDRALRIDPLWPRARFRYGQRNFANAGSAIEQQTQRTLELDPTYYPALQRQAKYRWQLHGDLAESVAIMERAIAADPEHPWGRHTAVAFYLDLEEPDSADAVVAGNAVAEGSTRALRAQYRGDWRAAGAAALQQASFEFGNAERWGVPSALRDLALRGVQREEIIRLLSRRYNLPLDKPWQLGAFNFREGQLLAHLLLATGKRAEALARFDEILAWIDANAFMGPVYNLRTRAQIMELKGDHDSALTGLAESFRQMDYTQWWYTLRYDPTWNTLRSDPRFLAIADEVQAHVSAQQRKLAQLRRDGAAPAQRRIAEPVRMDNP